MSESDSRPRLYLEHEIHECQPMESAAVRVFQDGKISGLFFNSEGKFAGRQDRELKNLVTLFLGGLPEGEKRLEISMEAWLNAVAYTLFATPLVEGDARLAFIEMMKSSIVEEEDGHKYLKFHSMNLRKGRPD